MLKKIGSSLFSPRELPVPAATSNEGDEDTTIISLNICEATGMPKVCDAYCVCVLQGVPLPGGATPRTPREASAGQSVKTETAKKTEQPRWRNGKAEFIVREVPETANLELSLMAQRMFGAELIGRTRLELASILAEAKADKWYSVKNKNNQDTGSIRMQSSVQGKHLKGKKQDGLAVDVLTSESSASISTEALMKTPNLLSPAAPSPAVAASPGTVQRRGFGGRPGNFGDAPLQPGVSFNHQIPAARGQGASSSRENTNRPQTSAPATFSYKIGEMVGRGAFGKVFQAMNLATGELMAVKCVDLMNVNQEELEEIKNEVQLLRSLRHRHVVSYIGTNQTEVALNILMEFCPGGSVATLSKSFGAFPEPVLQQYTRQMVEGIQYVHENAVMHRDIKGANILVAANGVLKIADFGASAQLKTVSDEDGTTSMRGTPFWMAPEVIRQEKYGRPADCWSMGMTVIEMATGNYPWFKPNQQAHNKFSLMYEIASTDHLPDIPEELSETSKDFILRFIKRQVSERMTAEQALQHPFLRDVVTLSM